MNRMNNLPDELYKMIYKNVYDNTLKEMSEMVDDSIGLKWYDCLSKTKYLDKPSCDIFYANYREENSDTIRNEYLKNKYETIDKKGKGVRKELDYWKLILDLERPTVWLNSWFVRKWKCSSQYGITSGINWNSTYEPSNTTESGWKRLLK